MVNLQEAVSFSDEEIRNYFTLYIQEYRRRAEALPPEQRKQLRLFTDYPFKILIFIDEKGTTVEYQPAHSPEIEITRVKETTKHERKPNSIIESFANIYLKRLINQPELNAKREIEDFISFEHHLEEEQEQAEAEWAAYEQEIYDQVIQNYADDNKRAYKINEETFSNKEPELYHIIQLLYNQHIFLATYLYAGCFTLFDTLEQTMSDLETSAFLAVHGKYEPAMGLLRRYLDTTLCSLYYDSELSKLARTVGTEHRAFVEFNTKKERWIETSFPMKFSGNGSILSKLLEGATDLMAKSVCTPCPSGSYQDYVEHFYYDLSKFVHYGGKNDDINFGIFQKFNEEKFKRWIICFHEVIEICNLLILLKYPKIAEIYDGVKEKNSGNIDFLSQKKILDVRIARFHSDLGILF